MKNVKTKRKLIITLMSLFALVIGLLLMSCSCGGTNYKISVDTSGLTIADGVVTVEFGEQLTVPSGVVVDDDGEEYELEVKYSLINQTDGKNIAKRVPIYNLENSTDYTLTYFVEEEDIEQITYTIKCRDTKGPAIETTGIRTNYDVGSTLEFNLSKITDASNYKEDTLKVTLVNTENAQDEYTLSVVGSVYSCELTTAGNYKLKIEVQDGVGNVGVYEQVIVIAEPFQEPDIANVLWGFDDTSAVSNVSALSDSDAFEAIVSNEHTNGSDYSLKLTLSANSSVKFLLVNPNVTNVDEMDEIVIKAYATPNQIDELRVANTIDYTAINFDHKVLYGEWTELKFKARDYYEEHVNVTELQFTIWVEEDTVLYIDGIYYTDYVAPWQDDSLAANQLATFNSIEYESRLGKVTDINNSSFGGQTDVLLAGDAEIPAGADGGVLKFTSTTTIAESLFASSGYTADGFYFDCAGKIYLEDIAGLYFKINYGGYVWGGLHVALVTDMGTQFHWHTMNLGLEGGYETLFIKKSEFAVDKDATYFTGMHIRLIKKVDEAKSAYFDEIGVTFPSTEQPTYQFDKVDSVDLTKVETYEGGVVYGIVNDASATDGFALKAGSAHNWSNNGFVVNFDSLKFSDYASIIVRYRVVGNLGTQLEFRVNDGGAYVEMATSATYKEVDLVTWAAGKADFTDETLDKIRFSGTSQPDVDVYIDCITFVTAGGLSSLDYQFESADSEDLDAVVAYGVGTIYGVVADTNATDGYALKAGSATNWSDNGFVINFADLNFSDYASITVRYRVEGRLGTQLQFRVNGAYVEMANSTTYKEVDLITWAAGNAAFTDETLNQIKFSGESQPDVDVYVDSITFVAK